ncbi:DUF1223 domain-containing protein [Ekhidna sp.]
MKTNLLALSLLLISSFVLAQQEKPIVIVELFTSEGCSSCPPADKLLSEIVNSSDTKVDIIGLSFHVDYWDYIGWKDPYASKDFTIRQRAYARKFRLNSIYTPQMVVNGKHEFVGSSKSKWRETYSSESATKSNLDLVVSSIIVDHQTLTFDVKSKATDSQINVAIVEKNLSQNVIRGENRGRTLSHDNVVRVYDTRRFDGKSNTFSLKVPMDLNFENASLIIYSQNSESWNVNGAKKISFASLLN